MSIAVVIAAVAAGAVGALVRHLVARMFAGRPARLPWAVLIVNVAGSLIGGIVLGLSQSGVWGADARYIVLSGLCGGLTTFSTFSTETIQLALEGRMRAAAISVGTNLVLGIGAAAAGWAIVAAAVQ
ncbi:CrcB family protein [Homoserinibacter sp. GY 40078]|uniref:FluC/FEX family fluoride channel n=1 Tax=Homoserinibacter sp. GY 40078 TaxID=2603275 RepID=UPI0011C99DE3|nr:CrcB family protein [Homoserinibacter sp. GY 40078]TXK18720.1 CrcB family protein [Homoserinibacter sp. GY 40078]